MASTDKPRFGDVYEWRATGVKVMVILDDPLAFITLSDALYPTVTGRVTAYSSNEHKVPFSSPTASWIRVDGR